MAEMPGTSASASAPLGASSGSFRVPLRAIKVPSTVSIRALDFRFFWGLRLKVWGSGLRAVADQEVFRGLKS